MGLTVKESSKILEIKPGTLNKYEIDIRNPSQIIMIKMVQTYSYTHQDVMIAYKENLEKQIHNLLKNFKEKEKRKL